MKILFDKTCTGPVRRFPFVLVDVGARGGIKKEWFPLKKYLKYIAFEPDPDECKKLTEQARDYEAVFYRTALWSSKTTLPLYLTQNEGFSSVYEPDQDFLRRFSPENTRGYAVKKTITMSADRLDCVLSPEEQRSLDFIKVDTEGCASEVLRGAETILSRETVVGVQVEAEFNPKYKGQTLFSDVDRELRRHGYQLYQAETCSWKRRAGLKTGGVQGQLVHGDFSYFLSPDIFWKKVESCDPEERAAKAIKYVVLLCLYGCFDLASEIFEDARAKGIFSEDLCRSLNKGLSAAKSVLLRVPKLEKRSLAHRLVYHAFMLFCGAWSKRPLFWQIQVELE